jgi:hypothetical protein
MERVDYLRSQARKKRGQAAELLGVGASLSFTEDRELLTRHAADLEAEAAKLEAEADVLAPPGDR